MHMNAQVNMRLMFADGTKPVIDEGEISTTFGTTSTFEYDWLEEDQHDCATGQLADNLHIGMHEQWLCANTRLLR